MASNMKFWRGVAIGFTLLNAGGMVYAAMMDELMHGGLHAALAVGGLAWIGALWQPRRAASIEADPRRIELLESEMSTLQQELLEARDRLDFTEQLLEKRPEPSRVERKE